jgi:hypothetical protein
VRTHCNQLGCRSDHPVTPGLVDTRRSYAAPVTPRDGRHARHRVPAQRQSSTPPEPPPHDPDLDSYLAALAPDANATETTGRFGSAQVFSLRLPALRMEQLRRLAASRGVSPTALAVDWVLERLDQEDTETGPLPIALDADAPAWRNALRRLGRE